MIFKHIAIVDDNFTVTPISKMQSGSNASNINKIGSYNFGSFEPSSIDVDNPRPLKTTNQPMALTSQYVCNDNGVFLVPVSFSVTFDSLVSFVGATINTDVLINEVEITEYAGDSLVDSAVYTGNNNYFEINANQVNKIVFKITKINTPNVFLDIFGINFGKVVFWDDSKVKDVKMVNNFSNVGRDLAIDTLSFTIPGFSDNVVFNEKQKLEVIDDNGVCKYTFYLKSYKFNEDKTQVSLEYADVIDLLDGETFYGGFYDKDADVSETPYLEDGKVETIVNKITEGYECSIEPRIASMQVYGYMPVVSKRNALIYIANATGCKILKHPNLQLVDRNQTVKYEFDDSNVFLGSVQRQTEKPTKQINFTSFNYYLDEEDKETDLLKKNTELYKKNETYIFQLSEPNWIAYPSYQAVGATTSEISKCCDIYEIGVNYIKIKSKYDFYLSMATYCHQKSTTAITVHQVGNYQLLNSYDTLNIDSFTLVNKNEKDSSIVPFLLNYYKERETITFKAVWQNPSLNTCVRFYGKEKLIKKITTSFGDVVELEVE